MNKRVWVAEPAWVLGMLVALWVSWGAPCFVEGADMPRVLPPVPEEGDSGGPKPTKPAEASKPDNAPSPDRQSGTAEPLGLPDLPVDVDQEEPDGDEDPVEESKPEAAEPSDDGDAGGTEPNGTDPKEAESEESTGCKPYLPNPSRDKLVKRIDAILSPKLLGTTRVGILAVTYPEGEVLYERGSTDQFNPASVAKIFTTAAVLLKLGSSRKYPTTVWQEPGACGALVVKGSGDPGLTSGRVAKLAAQVKAAGVMCASELKYDVSLFDGKNLPPAFDQQQGPDGFRAKVGALGMDFGAFWLNGYPTEPGQAARLETVPGSQCIQWENRAVTASVGERVGPDDELSATVSVRGEKVFVVVKGRVPTERKRGVSLSLALPDPDWFTACYVAEQLRFLGVQIKSGKYGAGRASGAARHVGELMSNSLGTDVVEMSRNSRNYMAEQMVKLLSEGRCKAYSFSCGLRVVRQVMRQLHVDLDCAVLKNGSGLFNANRITPMATVRFLTEVLNKPKLRGPFMKSLAQGHKSGTLKDRMKGVVLPVIAKTGTLDSVSALAGYLLRKEGGYVVFAMYFNGGKGSAKQRTIQDEIVGVLAEAVVGKHGNSARASKKDVNGREKHGKRVKGHLR